MVFLFNGEMPGDSCILELVSSVYFHLCDAGAAGVNAGMHLQRERREQFGPHDGSHVCVEEGHSVHPGEHINENGCTEELQI